MFETAIAEIYNHAVRTSTATFDLLPRTVAGASLVLFRTPSGEARALQLGAHAFVRQHGRTLEPRDQTAQPDRRVAQHVGSQARQRGNDLRVQPALDRRANRKRQPEHNAQDAR